MLAKAIEKLKAEIDGSKNNPNVKVVGEFLLRQLDNNGAAEKVIQEGKTIKGSINEMGKVAKTKAVDGCGMLTDQEGFKVVLKYFGIEGTNPVINLKPIENVQVPLVKKENPIEFKIELDF